MPPYSPELRARVLADCDAGMPTAQVAAKYSVSPAWVRCLKQRGRETGSIAPVEQRHGPAPKWAGHAERPDDTLAKHRAWLSLPLSVSTLWRAMKSLGLTVKRKS